MYPSAGDKFFGAILAGWQWMSFLTQSMIHVAYVGYSVMWIDAQWHSANKHFDGPKTVKLI